MSDLQSIDAITVGERHRRDMGDIAALARDIEERGLINPVTLNPDGKLLAGHRRLEACQSLGWLDIPARVLPVSTLSEMLGVEWAENALRKDFTPKELVAIGRDLEQEIARQARERQGSHGAAPGRPANTSGPGPGVSEQGRARDIVGRAVGVSGQTYQRAKAVVEAAEEDPEGFGDLADEMDRTGKVRPAYREVRQRQIINGEPQKRPAGERATQVAELAGQGWRAGQIGDEIGLSEGRVKRIASEHGITLPDAAIRSQRIDPHRVISETVSALEGTRIALDLINWEVTELDAEEAEHWVASLTESLAALRKLVRNLKEATHDQER